MRASGFATLCRTAEVNAGHRRGTHQRHHKRLKDWSIWVRKRERHFERSFRRRESPKSGSVPIRTSGYQVDRSAAATASSNRCSSQGEIPRRPPLVLGHLIYSNRRLFFLTRANPGCAGGVSSKTCWFVRLNLSVRPPCSSFGSGFSICVAPFVRPLNSSCCRHFHARSSATCFREFPRRNHAVDRHFPDPHARDAADEYGGATQNHTANASLDCRLPYATIIYSPAPESEHEEASSKSEATGSAGVAHENFSCRKSPCGSPLSERRRCSRY